MAAITNTSVTALLMALFLYGQWPDLPAQWFPNRTPSTPQAPLTFCYDERIPGWEVDVAIAEELAASLLLEVEFVRVDRRFHSEMEFDLLYVDLVDRCTAYLGFKLFSDSYPEWATLTRPFYEGRFVLVGTEGDAGHLEDLPPGTPIGVTQGTMGDIQFLTYNNELPSDRRWRRLPLGEPRIALQALLDGRVDALIIWEPELYVAARENEEFSNLRVLEAPLISEPWIGVGAMLTVNRTFELTLLDEGLELISTDGTVARILAEYNYPARPAR